MALKTYLACDRCGGDCVGDTIVRLGLEAAAIETLDLCPFCSRKVLDDVVQGMDYLDLVAWLRKIKRPEPPRLMG